MAAVPLGNLGEFNPDTETFPAYLERAHIFLAANSIEEGKQVPMFLNAIGCPVYEQFRDLMAPTNHILSLKEITDTLKAHFEPKSLKRFHFHKRDQASGESILKYVAKLRRLAAKHSFAGYLDEALCDHFVSGLQSDSIQKRLLSEVKLFCEQ